MKLRSTILAAPFVAALAMAACGKGVNTTSSTTPTPTQQQTQNQLQQPAKPLYDCAKVNPAAAPQGSPPDDLVGIRLGMPAKLVEVELACRKPPYTVGDGNGRFDVPYRNHGPQPRESVGGASTDEQDKVGVLLLGMPGQEVAAHLGRQILFAASDAQPTVDTERQALIQKYGPSTSDIKVSGSETLHWVYDTSGRPMSLQNPSYNNCANVGGYSSGFTLYAGCGLAISAEINSTDQGAVNNVDVGIMNAAAAQAAMDKETAAIKLADRPTGTATKF